MIETAHSTQQVHRSGHGVGLAILGALHHGWSLGPPVPHHPLAGLNSLDFFENRLPPKIDGLSMFIITSMVISGS